MKVIDDGKVLDKLCDYLHNHRRETGIKVKRVTNNKADVELNRFLGDTIGYINTTNKRNVIKISLWKSELQRISGSDNFKNLLKDFEAKNKIEIEVEMK